MAVGFVFRMIFKHLWKYSHKLLDFKVFCLDGTNAMYVCVRPRLQLFPYHRLENLLLSPFMLGFLLGTYQLSPPPPPPVIRTKYLRMQAFWLFPLGFFFQFLLLLDVLLKIKGSVGIGDALCERLSPNQSRSIDRSTRCIGFDSL